MLRRWRGAWPRRSKNWGPPLQQGNLGQPWPSTLEPAGARPRWMPKLRRGQRFDPQWQQGPQNAWTPAAATVSRPRRRAATARARFFPVPPPPAASAWRPDPVVARRRPSPRPVRRGRYAEPRWPQGQQTTWRPDPVAPRRRAGIRLRRSSYAEPPWPPPAPPPPMSFGRGWPGTGVTTAGYPATGTAVPTGYPATGTTSHGTTGEGS